MKYPYTTIGYQTEADQKKQTCKRNLHNNTHPEEKDDGEQRIDHRFHGFLKFPVFIDKKQEKMLNETDAQKEDHSAYQTL